MNSATIAADRQRTQYRNYLLRQFLEDGTEAMRTGGWEAALEVVKAYSLPYSKVLPIDRGGATQ